MLVFSSHMLVFVVLYGQSGNECNEIVLDAAESAYEHQMAKYKSHGLSGSF